VGVLVLGGLPALWHPVFEVPGFDQVSVDRFWLGIDAADPAFNRVELTRELEAGGALAVAWTGRSGE
jgi:hypothetical protein